MKNFMKWNLSVFQKILLIFILLLAPILILDFQIYHWGYDTIKKEISGATQSQLSWYGKLLEDEVVRIQGLQTDFVTEDDLPYLINTYPITDNFTRSSSMLRIQSRLEIIKKSSSYIENVVVHIPSLKKTISSNDGIQELWREWRLALKNYRYMNGSGIICRDNALLLDAQYPITTPKEETPLFVMEITLSNEAIRQTMESILVYPESTVSLKNARGTYAMDCGSASGTSSSVPFITVSSHLDILDMTLTSSIPAEHIFGKIQHYRFFFPCYIFLAFAAFLLFFLSMRRLIHRPVHELAEAFHRVENGDYAQEISYRHRDEFSYLYQAFNRMSRHLEELIHQVYEQKLLAQRAELKQLQSQINPHFLYNSFFNIYRMAKDEDCENIAVFSQYLGSYYQYITRNAANETALAAEYQHALTYCYIQEMRFHNHLKLHTDQLPEHLGRLLVPRLILQPLIENAFEHGLKEAETPQLSVTVSEKEEILLITVENNGPPCSEKAFQALQDKLNSNDTALETTAIINIHRRLRLKFGSSAGVSIRQKPVGGFCTILYIPIGKGEKDHV